MTSVGHTFLRVCFLLCFLYHVLWIFPTCFSFSVRVTFFSGAVAVAQDVVRAVPAGNAHVTAIAVVAAAADAATATCSCCFNSWRGVVIS